METLFGAMLLLFVLNLLLCIYLIGLTKHTNNLVDLLNSAGTCIDNHAENINKIGEYVNNQSDVINSMLKTNKEFEKEYNKLVDSFNRLSEYTMAVSDLVESQHYALLSLENSGEINIPQENKTEIIEAEDHINELYKKLEEDFELVGGNEDEC